MSKSVRDPIHGMIELRPEEWAAVDAPVFQRLRSIRQLAMTHLVYPGTMHTRFEHSIGVRSVAGRLAAKLRLGEEEQRVVCVAALLHDVGHGPFSHVSEQVIDELSGVHGVHEAVSVHIMRHDPDLRAALGEELLDRAAVLIGLEGARTVESDIVSGPTDADKLDYLLRDSYYAGVRYGEYDLVRIIDSARVIAPRSAQTQLGFDIGGLWAVEGLLLARHHMHRQVYGHKTRLATDIMVTRALKLGIEQGELPVEAYRVAVDADQRPLIDEKFVRAYLGQTDAHVLYALLSSREGSPVHDLARRLRRRDLLRQTVSMRLDLRKHELGQVVYSDILDREVFTGRRVAELERQIASELDLDTHLVALYVDARANPTYRQPSAPVGSKDVMLQRGADPPQLLQAESEIFRDQVAEEHSWLYLYTPRLQQDKTRKAKEVLWDALKRD